MDVSAAEWPSRQVDSEGPAARDDRGVSTVLDVALALLLVTAAVATVSGVTRPEPDPAARAADETATALATATGNVSYSLSGSAASATALSFPRTTGPAFQRHEHGTLAQLLAGAALANVSRSGAQLVPTGAAMRAAVSEAVRDVLVGPGWRGRVVARWAPYAGSTLAGSFEVGGSPPPDAAVHVARIAVPSGIHVSETTIQQAAHGGYEELGTVLARAILNSWFPPERTRQALSAAYPRPRLTELRYRSVADSYDTAVRSQVRSADPVEANEQLAAAMGAAFAAEMRARFDSPAAAAGAVDPGTVTVVVRTWST